MRCQFRNVAYSYFISQPRESVDNKLMVFNWLPFSSYLHICLYCIVYPSHTKQLVLKYTLTIISTVSNPLTHALGRFHNWALPEEGSWELSFHDVFDNKQRAVSCCGACMSRRLWFGDSTRSTRHVAPLTLTIQNLLQTPTPCPNIGGHRVTRKWVMKRFYNLRFAVCTVSLFPSKDDATPLLAKCNLST